MITDSLSLYLSFKFLLEKAWSKSDDFSSYLAPVLILLPYFVVLVRTSGVFHFSANFVICPKCWIGG